MGKVGGRTLLGFSGLVHGLRRKAKVGHLRALGQQPPDRRVVWHSHGHGSVGGVRLCVVMRARRKQPNTSGWLEGQGGRAARGCVAQRQRGGGGRQKTKVGGGRGRGRARASSIIGSKSRPQHAATGARLAPFPGAVGLGDLTCYCGFGNPGRLSSLLFSGWLARLRACSRAGPTGRAS